MIITVVVKGERVNIDDLTPEQLAEAKRQVTEKWQAVYDQALGIKRTKEKSGPTQ